MANGGLPAWLPAMFPTEPWSKELYDRLYKEVFCRDFKSTPIFYRGHAVWYHPDMALGRELIFVHLTSRKKSSDSDEREIRSERCARLPWARPLIEHPDDPAVLSWDFEEGDGSISTYVWLQHHDYVIIMRKKEDDTRRLITAYYIEFNHERRKFQKKCERRIQ
jgi:hypothetical protein